MPRAHDRGGWPDAGPIDRTERELSPWEKRVDALRGALGSRGLVRADELRRAIEALDPETYERLSYYERWTAAIEALMVEKGLLTREEIDRRARRDDT